MNVREWWPFSKQVFAVMRSAVADWVSHRAASKGAALAFYTLFSMAPILLMVSLVVSAALAILENYVNGLWKQATVLLSWLASAIGFGVIALLFGVIYKLLPRIRLSWSDVTIGALGTAAL